MMTKFFVFRNMTVERFFSDGEVSFSGYEDISTFDTSAELYVWFYLAPLKANHHAAAAEISNYLAALNLVLSKIPSDKTFVALTMATLFDIETVTSSITLRNAIEEYNHALFSMTETFSNLKVVDFQSFLNLYPKQEWFDWKYYLISQMAINPRLAVPFQNWFKQQMKAINLKRKKCLVLDMDNTLWGGILGEDGISGIALGGNYPGNAFQIFQSYIAELGKQGVILAACSKNNLTDIELLWQSHPDNILTGDNFAAYRINWTDKATNIRQISDELNIGLDSMVFIDDNPSERELIRENLPEVTVPEFPLQPYMLPDFIKKIAEEYFSVYSLTKEDLAKTEQYKANAKRNNLKTRFVNMDDYIRNLQIELRIEPVADISLPRVAQMTQKTNQFNLTTHRYTDSELRAFLNEGAQIYTLSVKDKFGDSGITGACIVRMKYHAGAEIDTFLLSCRILGKKIENEFLKIILNKLNSEGISIVSSKYIPSKKNMQTADFYENNGFKCIKSENGTKYYQFELKNPIDLSDNYIFIK